MVWVGRPPDVSLHTQCESGLKSGLSRVKIIHDTNKTSGYMSIPAVLQPCSSRAPAVLRCHWCLRLAREAHRPEDSICRLCHLAPSPALNTVRRSTRFVRSCPATHGRTGSITPKNMKSTVRRKAKKHVHRGTGESSFINHLVEISWLFKFVFEVLKGAFLRVHTFTILKHHIVCLKDEDRCVLLYCVLLSWVYSHIIPVSSSRPPRTVRRALGL